MRRNYSRFWGEGSDLQSLRINPNNAKFYKKLISLSKDPTTSQNKVLWVNLAAEFYHAKATNDLTFKPLLESLRAFRRTGSVYPLVSRKVTELIFQQPLTIENLMTLTIEIRSYQQLKPSLETQFIEKLDSFSEISLSQLCFFYKYLRHKNIIAQRLLELISAQIEVMDSEMIFTLTKFMLYLQGFLRTTEKELLSKLFDKVIKEANDVLSTENSLILIRLMSYKRYGSEKLLRLLENNMQDAIDYWETENDYSKIGDFLAGIIKYKRAIDVPISTKVLPYIIENDSRFPKRNLQELAKGLSTFPERRREPLLSLIPRLKL